MAISYASKSLTDSEVNVTQAEKELYAILLVLSIPAIYMFQSTIYF